jgi:hypothetical protein
MSIKQYRFVSPGIFINEIDNSQLPEAPSGIGPLVIGRAERGPSMRPVELQSFSEQVEIFGNPVPGGIGGDVWRDGNRTSPMYAGYASQAYLANRTPLTFLRLLGYNHEDRTSTAVEAGWNAGAAFGLFIAPLNDGSATVDAALSAIVYVEDADVPAGRVGLVGTTPGGDSVDQRLGAWVLSQGSDFEFLIQIGDDKIPFNFSKTSKKFLRRALNTNPTLTNSAITESDALKSYWLGETFESHLEAVAGVNSTAGQHVAMLVHLDDGGAEAIFDKSDLKLEAQPPVTSWVFSQHLAENDQFTFNKSSLEMNGTKKLFRLKGLNDGEWTSKKLKIGFTDIKASDDEFNPYGTFTVIVRVTSDSDNAPEYVERYANCNLNPISPDYIGRKIGDMDSVWSYSESRYRMLGQHPNRSRFVRVEMDPDVDAGTTDAELLPFGFYGPAVPRPTLVTSGSVDIALDTGVDVGADLSDVLTDSTDIGHTAAGVGTSAFSATKFDYGGGETFRLLWPAMACRTASTIGNLSNGTRSFFGVTSNQANGVKQEPSYLDFTRPYSTTLRNGDGIIGPEVGAGDIRQQAMPQLKSSGAFSGDCFVGLINQTVTITEAGVDPIATNVVAGDNIQVTVDGSAKLFVPGSDYVIGLTLEESLENLVAAINAYDFGTGNGAGGDVCATLSAPNTASFKITLAGITDAACTQLDLSTASAGTLTLTPSANTCTVDVVKVAAGDYFENGIVPYFSLDDLVMQDVDQGAGTKVKSRQHVDWLPGSRYAGASVTVLGTTQAEYDAAKCLISTKPGTYRDILEHGYDQFTLPLVGGFDGLDITEKDPFRNTLLAGQNELSHYTFNSIKRAIDSVADPEVLDMNLACVPGITNPALTTHLTEVCRDRADCLAIIDLENDYVPRHEGTQPEFDRLPDPRLAVQDLKDRRINNSYGACYFPWVQVRDNISNAVLWMPPSVAALGTMAYSETRPGSELWFAPAGFNRGGLTQGAAGIPVTNVRYRLTSKERDLLYEANINPIASFPSEGIVVFGNKTLQVTPSALDRINVRRLMIFLKKEVSRIAATILFDQNVKTTWKRFTSQVEPFLSSVQSRFGLTEFKVVLDETTTTADLIDRNILYAKVFLKPARAIEFIAIDFNITRTGASFTD